MSRARDISIMLSKTEVDNTSNLTLLNTSSQAAGGLDSAQVQNVGLQKFTTLDSLPSTGLTSGQQAWVESSGRLYISNGSGWYNVALVNASPTLTLDQSGTIQLNPSNLTVTVTASASDSDDNDAMISFSVESDGNMAATGTTISQDSSVFTITADSAGGSGVAGNFTLTFKATDGIAVDNENLNFSLSFTSIVDSSAETMLLMKATGNNATNAAITYQNSSDVSTGFTEAGTPQASTFSPYRSAGYSTYFDGSGDYLVFDNSNESLVPEAGDFTLEFWFNTWQTSREDPFSCYDGSAGFAVALNYPSAGGVMVYYGNTITQQTAAGGHFETNTWNHCAIERSGNTQTIYINGQSVVSGTVTQDYSGTTDLHIGQAANNSLPFYGWLRDLRFVKGSAVYGGNFTPPTEPLTAITNTQLLTCHLPYFGDGSTNNRTTTVNGNAHTVPFGPYDYSPWISDDGGSVYFDGTDDRLELASLPDLSAGNWTIEGWYRFDTDPNTATYILWSLNDEATNGYAQLMTAASTAPLRLQQRGGLYLTNSTTFDMYANEWYHLAAVWDGTNQKVYVNGKERLSSTTNVIQNAGNGLTINGDGGGNYEFAGSIADFRISTSARYTAEFTAPTAPLSHDSNTVLLMNNKSDANIYDASSSYPLKLTGNTISSTTQRKFTTSSSMYFDGTGDYITVDDGFSFGTSDFTFEFWLYPTENLNSAIQHFINPETSGSGVTWGFSTNTYQGFNGITFSYGQWGSFIVGKYANNVWPAQNTWTHLAVQRRNGTIAIFVNGTSQTLTTYNENSTFSDGADLTSNYTSRDFFSGLQGYVQDVRITKGYGRYAGNFTPPAVEFEL